MSNSSHDDAAPIHPAATVILIRDSPSGLETLLVRRNTTLAFHGGSWVFPGGRVDPSDYLSGAPPPEPSDPDHEPAARSAAIREAQEEAGLLVDDASLVPFAHWTTPPGRARRFATWFFVAPFSEGVVAIDGSEITDHRWFTPADALRAQSLGEIELPPPTYVSLSWLAPSATVDHALVAAHHRAYTRFAPEVHGVEGGLVFVYPGDVAYEVSDRLDDPAPRHRLWALESGWRYECP